jgi:hypothetical protein
MNEWIIFYEIIVDWNIYLFVYLFYLFIIILCVCVCVCVCVRAHAHKSMYICQSECFHAFFVDLNILTIFRRPEPCCSCKPCRSTLGSRTGCCQRSAWHRYGSPLCSLRFLSSPICMSCTKYVQFPKGCGKMITHKNHLWCIFYTQKIIFDAYFTHRTLSLMHIVHTEHHLWCIFYTQNIIFDVYFTHRTSSLMHILHTEHHLLCIFYTQNIIFDAYFTHRTSSLMHILHTEHHLWCIF